MNIFDTIIQAPPYISTICTPYTIKEKLDIIKPIYDDIKYDIDCFYIKLKFIIQIIRDSCINIENNKDSFGYHQNKIIIGELIEFGISLLYMNKNEDIENSDIMLQNLYDIIKSQKYI